MNKPLGKIVVGGKLIYSISPCVLVAGFVGEETMIVVCSRGFSLCFGCVGCAKKNSSSMQKNPSISENYFKGEKMVCASFRFQGFALYFFFFFFVFFFGYTCTPFPVFFSGRCSPPSFTLDVSHCVSSVSLAG